MKNTAAVCLAVGGAKPPKSDTASVGNHRSDDVARFLRLPLIDSPLSSFRRYGWYPLTDIIN